MNIEKVGRYELISLIGEGGMGEVYRAHDPELNREVAVKIISRPVLDRAAKAYRRFQREVQTAARLNHSHIITVFDVNLEHRPPYVVMELLTGGTLTSFLNNKALDWPSALRLLLPICGALTYAHKAGVVHRDVKPDNILFAGQAGEQPKLADFGLAFLQDAERLTQDGTILGTLSYLSPEQVHGTPVDARADIFSLGVILFETIAGYNPLRGKTISQTLINAASLEPIDLSPLVGKVPEAVITLLDKALAKERRLRFASCEQLENDIDQLLGGHQSVRIKVEPKATESELRVENPYAISLVDTWDEILNKLFADYRQITVEEELKGGFSGSRVFVVKPVRTDGTPELPSVVKIGPIQLVRQEWQAYQDHIRHKLPGIAEIRGDPVVPADQPWGGIHYVMIGSGTFYFESLTQYYRRAAAVDIAYILTQRLFRQLGRLWRFNSPKTEFNLAASYDHLLPVNLVIRPTPDPGVNGSIELKAGSIPPDLPSPGTQVRLNGFVVVEVDEDEKSVTLDWPTSDEVPSSYRVRLQPVINIEEYQIGLMLNHEFGIVSTTRLITLKATLLTLLGVDFNTSASELTLTGDHPLPNPLERLSNILASRPTVRLASIHGDLNSENILVDPETRDVQLIDFGSARRDHVLHDLLRLETAIVTRLLPDSLKRAHLPADAVVKLYTAVHYTGFARSPETAPPLSHPELEKPFSALLAIRQAATNLLFDANEPTEYYQGLTLYLLGSLKYRNLDELAKRVAFYAAAAVQSLVDNPLPSIPKEPLTASSNLDHAAPSKKQDEDLAPKSPNIKQTPLSPHQTKMTEMKKRLQENWFPAVLIGLLIMVLGFVVVNSLGGQAKEITSTIEPSPEMGAGIRITETSSLPTSTNVLSTATLLPTATSPVQPPIETMSSPLELFTQEADQFTSTLDDRSGDTTVALLLDTSASMRDEDKLTRSLAGAIGFLNRFDENDQVLVFTYGGQALLLNPSGSIDIVREPLQQKFNQLFAAGEPMLYDALCQAAEALNDVVESNPERLIVIVLLTDGKDSGRGKVLTEPEVFACLPETVQIHAIALGDDADQDFLQELVNQTNGRFYSITPEEVLDIFGQISFD